MKTGQTHVQKYTRTLLEMIQQGKIDTTFLISHHASLEDGPDMYRHWHDDQDRYTKIVLKPGMQGVERVANATASQEKQHEPA
jgi:threonine dehydrogenase-like Zn-dependent dehydrogenase